MASTHQQPGFLTFGLWAAAAGLITFAQTIAEVSEPDRAPNHQSTEQPEPPEPNPTHKPGQRFTIGKPARSNGPDLNQPRSANQPSNPANPSPPTPDLHPFVPAPWANPTTRSQSWYWPSATNFQLGIGYNDAVYYYPPIAGVYSRIDPNLVIYPPTDRDAVPPAPPTAAELLFNGQFQEASSLLAAELEESPNDPERMRYLAVALAGEGRFDEAAESVFEVYEADPEIATYPIDGDALIQSPLELRRLVVGAVRHAQRTGTARDWLLVAVLMQAEGRDDVALKMIGRASEQGLDARIAEAWPGAPS